MQQRLGHLLLTTTEDAFDVKSWSGIPYSLRTALAGCVDRLSVLCLTAPKRTPLNVARRVAFGAGKYPLWISKQSLRGNAARVGAAIRKDRPDAVLSISSQSILALEAVDMPLFLFSDAPYMTFAETYAQWENFPVRLEEFGLEEAALAQRLSGLCFGSAWACDEARMQYGLSQPERERKLHVTPLGANFQPAGGASEVEARIELRNPQELHLLFVGRDWERKGGPLAVEVAGMIHASGQAVRLHVVGCRPELGAAAEAGGFITIHGLLSRDNPEQRGQLENLYLESHFLITPTLAECFGIVFAEAQAFGLPPISRAVHAVPSIVEDGITGLLFAPEAQAAAYVERILPLFNDPPAYKSMAHAARQRFEATLNWDSCARGITDAIAANLAGD